MTLVLENGAQTVAPNHVIGAAAFARENRARALAQRGSHLAGTAFAVLAQAAPSMAGYNEANACCRAAGASPAMGGVRLRQHPPSGHGMRQPF